MNLAATMSLNAGQFQSVLGGVRGGLANVIGHIRGLIPLVTGLGGAFAAFKSTEKIIENFFKAFEKGHELEKMHRITGESISDLVILQKAFSNAGIDSGDLQRQLVMLQKSLGGVNEQGEPTKHIFSQLGLSIEELQKLGAPAQLEAIGAKLRDLPNAAQRTATAMAIFGRGGAEMLAVLDDPEALQEAMKSAAELGALYQRNAAIFSKIVVLMNSIKGKVSGLFAGLAEGAAPLFKMILEQVKQIDLAKIGRDIGSVLRAIPAAMEQGQIGTLLQLALQLAFAKAINFFHAALSTTFAVLGEVLALAFEEPFVIMLLSAAAQFGAALLKACNKPLAYIQAFFEHLADPGTKLGGWARDALAGTPLGLALAIGSPRPGNTKPTIGETADDIAKSGVLFGFGGEAMTADQIGAQARQDFAASAEKAAQRLAEVGVKIKEILEKAKISDIAGAAGVSAQLQELLKKLLPPLGDGEGKGERGGAGLRALGNGDKGVSPLTDKLARIGGFIGGSGGPAMAFARRTAENTSEMVKQIQQLPSALTMALRSGNYDEVFGSYR